MNAATQPHPYFRVILNGVPSAFIKPVSELEEAKRAARTLADAGNTVRLVWVKQTEIDEINRKAEADFKARVLATVGHEDDDGSMREIAMTNGWL